MSEFEDNSIIVIDDFGNEKEMQIYFTFDSEDYGKSYVLFYDPANEAEIFAAAYDAEGNLFPIEEEDQEEWNMVNEVLEAFNNEEENDEEEGDETA